MSYMRPLWCNSCKEFTEQSVLKMGSRMVDGDLKVTISHICSICKIEGINELETSGDWRHLLKNDYYGGGYAHLQHS